MEATTLEQGENTNVSTQTVAEPEVNPSPEQRRAFPKRETNDKHWLFDKEMARQAGLRSAEARERAKQEAKEAKAIVGQLKVAAIVEPTEVYRLNRLALVRSQLSKADSELTELLSNPKADQSRLKAILEASKVLSEQERKLANRPDPGSHRPSRQKPTRASTGTGPVDAE